jgi:hypothetical protein
MKQEYFFWYAFFVCKKIDFFLPTELAIDDGITNERIPLLN